MHNTVVLTPCASTFTDAVFTYIVACMWTIGHTTKMKELDKAFLHSTKCNSADGIFDICNKLGLDKRNTTPQLATS